MAGYTITPDTDEQGASIHFPKDSELLAKFKATFPKARWRKQNLTWHVPGVRARTRLERWAVEHIPADRPFEADRLRDELKTFAPLKSRLASYTGGTVVVVRTPYDQRIVTILRAIPGATWNATTKAWFIPLERTAIDALRAALPTLEALAIEAQAAQAAEKAAREAKWAAEKAARNQARQAELAAASAAPRRPRSLYPLGSLPPLHTPIRQGDAWIVYEGYGKDFRIGEDDPSCYGSHLLGHEGDYGCYCYYREATPAEAEAAAAERAARQAAQAAENARRDELRAAWTQIRDTGERPDGRDNRAEGTTIYLSQRDRESIIYGSGNYLVVGEEWIWAIMQHGMDGDDWSANNVRTGGAGAIGWRIPTDAKLAARLLELGQEMGLAPELERAAEQARFAAEWTLETTQARRADWNGRVRAGEFGTPGGRTDYAALEARQKTQGWTAGDLKRAIQLHQLPKETL